MTRKKSHIISKSTGFYYKGLNDNNSYWTNNPEQAVAFNGLKEAQIIGKHLYKTEHIKTELDKNL